MNFPDDSSLEWEVARNWKAHGGNVWGGPVEIELELAIKFIAVISVLLVGVITSDKQ